MFFVAILVGFLTGIISGCGIGGGSMLVLYLTAVMGVEQYLAGGVNLLYFTGCAPAALVSHIRNKRIVLRAVWWCVLAGIPVSIGMALLAGNLPTVWLRRAFGVVLLYIGIKELRTKSKTR